MTLLALDTSTATTSIALYRLRPAAKGQLDYSPIIAEQTWQSGQRQTTQLLPRVEALLASVELRTTDLSALAVALGPGSFNGLRVGIATAKLVSVGLGIPLVGIDSLRITAEPYREMATYCGFFVRPIYDALRGQVATSLYRADPNSSDLIEVEGPRLANLNDLIESANTGNEKTVFCGELSAGFLREIEEKKSERLIVGDSLFALRRASFLARLGKMAIERGETSDVGTLQPLYLRRPPVLEKGGN